MTPSLCMYQYTLSITHYLSTIRFIHSFIDVYFGILSLIHTLVERLTFLFLLFFSDSFDIGIRRVLRICSMSTIRCRRSSGPHSFTTSLSVFYASRLSLKFIMYFSWLDERSGDGGDFFHCDPPPRSPDAHKPTLQTYIAPVCRSAANHT